MKLRELWLEEAALGVRVNALQRRSWAARASSTRSSRRSSSARGMQVVIAVELEALHQGQRSLDFARLGDGDGPGELDATSR